MWQGLKFEVKVSGFAEDLDKKDFATAAGYVSKTSELKAKYIVESLDKPDDVKRSNISPVSYSVLD